MHGRAVHTPHHCQWRRPHAICDMPATLPPSCPALQGAGVEQTYSATGPRGPLVSAASCLQPSSVRRSARPEQSQFCGDQGSRRGGRESRDGGRAYAADSAIQVLRLRKPARGWMAVGLEEVSRGRTIHRTTGISSTPSGLNRWTSNVSNPGKATVRYRRRDASASSARYSS